MYKFCYRPWWGAPDLPHSLTSAPANSRVDIQHFGRKKKGSNDNLPIRWVEYLCIKTKESTKQSSAIPWASFSSSYRVPQVREKFNVEIAPPHPYLPDHRFVLNFRLGQCIAKFFWIVSFEIGPRRVTTGFDGWSEIPKPRWGRYCSTLNLPRRWIGRLSEKRISYLKNGMKRWNRASVNTRNDLPEVGLGYWPYVQRRGSEVPVSQGCDSLATERYELYRRRWDLKKSSLHYKIVQASALSAKWRSPS
jgi:hypothetical protein